MNILLLGNNGQVGFELQRTLAPLGKVTALDFPDVDFLQLDQLAALVRKHNPAVIVNAAAYTAVDKAESDPVTAHTINGAAVGAPTFAGFLANFTAKMIDYDRVNVATRAKHLSTYHVTAHGEASWHTFDSYAVQCALDCSAPLQVTPARIAAISTSQYPLPAPRPSNSRMCVDKFEGTFGIACPDWRTDCQNVVTALIRGAHS